MTFRTGEIYQVPFGIQIYYGKKYPPNLQLRLFEAFERSVSTSFINIWNKNADANMPDRISYLASGQTCYMFSTSSSDNGKTVSINAMTESGGVYTDSAFQATLGTPATTPVALSVSNLYRFFSGLCPGNAGNIYIMKTNALTDGLPTDPNDVLLKIPFDTKTQVNTGRGVGNMAGYTVPTGKVLFIGRPSILPTSGKATEAQYRFRYPGQDWIWGTEFPITQESGFDFGFFAPPLTEGMDFELLTRVESTPVAAVSTNQIAILGDAK